MRSGGVVCSKPQSHLIDARAALLMNRYRSSLNRPPQPSLREGIPALLRRGMDLTPFSNTPFRAWLSSCAALRLGTARALLLLWVRILG
jgi:hypothetical protein